MIEGFFVLFMGSSEIYCLFSMCLLDRLIHS